MSELQDRVFVVTGANTGIGRETARELARRGARVVFACRSLEKTRPVMDAIASETRSEALGFVSLDLASLAAVKRAAGELLEREPRIDVLINNAGLAGPRGQTEDGFELAFGVNYLGPYLLTRLLFERLEASAAPRVVNVASGSHEKARGIDFDAVRRSTPSVSGFPEYAVSKLGNVLFTRELARRHPHVKAHALHPGVIASDVWRRVPWPVRPVMKLFMLSEADGARTSLWCATSPELAEQSGRYYDDCREREPSRVARDDALARELWERSEDWVRRFL